jgi:hypothetical protein
LTDHGLWPKPFEASAVHGNRLQAVQHMAHFAGKSAHDSYARPAEGAFPIFRSSDPKWATAQGALPPGPLLSSGGGHKWQISATTRDTAMTPAKASMLIGTKRLNPIEGSGCLAAPSQ